MQAILTLKADANVEDFKNIIDPFRANMASQVPAMHASAWAADSSDSRKIFLFVGWDSIEVSLVLAQCIPQY